MSGDTDFYARHRDVLNQAMRAIDARDYWSPFPETPSRSIYGEDAAAEGEKAFQTYLGTEFPIEVPGATGTVNTERSPYGFDLDIRYPHSSVDALVTGAGRALPAWRDAGPQVRAGVAAEILHRLNGHSFEMAQAVRHTTGQPFVMAFQAGGPHAQDRGLEAVAYALAESTRQPGQARWSKPQRGGDPLQMQNTFTVVPRGVALVIGCNTFPTWNSYPGLFASLVTGNPVIVKPHPGAVLPLAITVQVARQVLAEAGFNPDLVILAAEENDEHMAAGLATHPDVRIVDFTGSSEFGNWLERHAHQARVFTEKSGLNCVIIDSTDDYRGMLRNLAFSLSLYSGQMCTTPQNLLVPRDGIDAGEAGHKSIDEFCDDLGNAVDKLLADPKRALGTLGAIVNNGVRQRLADAPQHGTVVHAAEEIPDPEYPDATIRTPLIIRLDAMDRTVYADEWFGPISFVIGTDSTRQSLEVFLEVVREKGALTAAVYSSDDDVLTAARVAALDAGANLSENLTGGVFVNQSAAFSDFHGSGANPAATTALTEPAFVTGRFSVLQSRRHV